MEKGERDQDRSLLGRKPPLGAAGHGQGTRGDPAEPRPDGGPAPVQGPETSCGHCARRAADGADPGWEVAGASGVQEGPIR